MPPDSGLATEMFSGVKGKKIRITYAFTANADGSEKLRPIVIGRAMKPRAFGKKTGKELGFCYFNNATAWMTSEIYQSWLEDWDKELGKMKRKILLLQDNFAGHIVPDGLKYIRVENFAPNLTSHVQPMDQGIIQCFKAHYRAAFILRAIDHYEMGVTPSKIYDIDQLQAMRIADAAWRKVDTTTIRHCWRKADILPTFADPKPPQPVVPITSLLNPESDNNSSNENPIANAEKIVEDALNELSGTGALQKNNRMDINSLLNPEDESIVAAEMTDEEICQAVLEVQEMREKMPITGSDDVGDSDDVLLEARPTYREVLLATSVINRYIDGIDSPVARQMEAVLPPFTRQIRLEQSRTMVSTNITDYFTRK